MIQNSEFTIGNSPWWVQRWLELLDSYRFKKRLERARIYAREGNVLNIEFEGAKVLAKVQGSEPEPYQVSLSLDPFTDEDWNYVIYTLSQKAIFSAQLLAGEMPDKIEEVFTANGLSLFPFTLSDIHSRCNCPDKANPCKHIGAVYYQLGDRFSEDPFVLFQLRGRTKEQILEALRQLRSQESAVEAGLSGNSTDLPTVNVENPPAQKPEIGKKPQKTSNIEQFWQYDEPLDSSLVAIVPPADGKTVLNLLGRIPLAYADAQAVEQYLEQVYRTASQQAIVSALSSD
ncbi:MAG: SWIM zinc finger family protein [Hydrococcus sp. C42_A2020_068]|nr:SWIM zinc finger family protein [Hydrococcus sp. C42_A2020_068]